MRDLRRLKRDDQIAAAREAAHAFKDGDRELAQKIADATPGATVESEFHKEFRRAILEEA